MEALFFIAFLLLEFISLLLGNFATFSNATPLPDSLDNYLRVSCFAAPLSLPHLFPTFSVVGELYSPFSPSSSVLRSASFYYRLPRAPKLVIGYCFILIPQPPFGALSALLVESSGPSVCLIPVLMCSRLSSHSQGHTSGTGPAPLTRWALPYYALCSGGRSVFTPHVIEV